MPTLRETWDAGLLAVYTVSVMTVITVILFNLQAAVYVTKNFQYVVLIGVVAAFGYAGAIVVEQVRNINVLRDRLRLGVLSYSSNDVAPGITKQDIVDLVAMGGINYLRSSESVVALTLRMAKTGGRLYGEFEYIPGYLYSSTKALRVEVIST